ncbi:MAG TPA: hypothetical protein PLA65_15535 [Spirochaetota bacterium]|nr:hypothetical protein [Spirochaetota bacterium]HOD15555.1 hypothetical protein [Spirochaetota bacterium]HPG49226.1 hypothetical protein [Spirochaetota bacterium]HPN13470.1 hypothetical protein [Spirochaetota bacterium]
MHLHAAVGGRLGITRDEIDRLLTLDKNDFEYREWLALKYARELTLLDGAEPESDYMDDFRLNYTGKERARILKLVRMMRFANLWNNTLRGRPWRTGAGAGGSCAINVGGQPR